MSQIDSSNATSPSSTPKPDSKRGRFPDLDQPVVIHAQDDAAGEDKQTALPSDDQANTGSGQPRIMAFLNQKGGVGKTTTTVNVAAGLARAGQRVLTIDLDPQAHLTLSLGLDTQSLHKSVYDLLTDRETSAMEVVEQVNLDQTPQRGDHGDHEPEHVNPKTPTQMAILPAEVNLAGVESELAEMLATGSAQTVLRNKTSQLVQQFDAVLIDCPPSLGLLTINGLTLANEVIVPMQAHFLALQGLSKLFETVQMVGEGINPALRVSGIVLCMHEGNTILAGEVQSDLQAFLDSARDQDVPWSEAVVYQPPIRRNIKLAECPSFGQSIFDYAPDSRGTADYAALTESIAHAHV